MSGVAERAATTRTKHVEVGDVRYAYRELGSNDPVDKTPVLFLHRFRGTLGDWDPLFVDVEGENARDRPREQVVRVRRQPVERGKMPER